MRKPVILALAGMSACLVSNGAAAKAGDVQWAACVWQTDGEAAGNWLGMEVPKWSDKPQSPNEALGLRLIAICDATPADVSKPNRVPNWKSMRQQLLKGRPKAPTVPRSTAITARQCNHYAVKGSERSLYLSETSRVEGRGETIVHQTYFGDAGTGAVRVVDHAGRAVSFQFAGALESGAPLRLPQVTMIASPSAGYSAEKSCRSIGADGSLN